MPNYIDVNPSILEWAFERATRSGKNPDSLFRKYHHFEDWLTGKRKPTWSQLEGFSQDTYTPFGFFYLDSPPDDELPIADFRTMDSAKITPSVNLIETVQVAQERQEWFHSYLLREGAESLPFIGYAEETTPIRDVARYIDNLLDLPPISRRPHKADVFIRLLIQKLEMNGILVNANSIVDNSTKRLLDPEEFRGFSLSDNVAPLIFVNTADAHNAQIFTLMHELAHLLRGESGVSDSSSNFSPSREEERWANSVAAEVLVPANDIELLVTGDISIEKAKELARRYCISSTVVIHRAHDLHLITDSNHLELQKMIHSIQRVDRDNKREQSGHPTWYDIEFRRVGRTFATAVISDTYSGNTLFQDAYSLLGVKQSSTFDKMAEKLGMAI